MSRGGFSMGKQQRAARQAEKKRAKEERRWQKRDQAPSEDEIVSAADVVGDLPSIAQAMRNLPVPGTQAPSTGGERRTAVRLFVGRLSWDTTAETLRQRFAEFGEVIDAVIAEDRDTGRSRGFGFVELADHRESKHVIASLDGTDLDGRQIVVNVATERGRRPEHGHGFHAHSG